MKNLTRSFLGGLVVAGGALVLETVYSIFFSPSYAPSNSPLSFNFLLFSAILEEILMLAVVYKLSRQWISYSQAILNGLLVVIGFSALETSLNILGQPDFLISNLPVLFFPFLIHLVTGIIYALLSFWEKSHAAFYLAIALLLGIAFHLAFNLGFIFN